MTEAEFSRPVAVDRLRASETVLKLAAQPAERARLAERFDLLAIDRLEATVRLRRIAGGRLVRLRGSFVADVVQACVVTLAPVPQHLEDSFEMIFGDDAGAGAEPGKGEATHELVLDMADSDPPDPIVDGVIDAGEAVAEHLSLALDPFVRAPDAHFEGVAEAEAEEEPAGAPAEAGPFAVLASLKGKNE